MSSGYWSPVHKSKKHPYWHRDWMSDDLRIDGVPISDNIFKEFEKDLFWVGQEGNLRKSLIRRTRRLLHS